MLGRFGKLGNITPAYRASGGGGKTYKLFDAWDFSTKNNDSPNPEQVVGEKGHILNLRNFAFAGSSGYGVYSTSISEWEYWGEFDAVDTNLTRTIKNPFEQSHMFFFKMAITEGDVTYFPAVSDIPLEISGLVEGSVLTTYSWRTGSDVRYTTSIRENGKTVYPRSDYYPYTGGTSGVYIGISFSVKGEGQENVPITIKLLPANYEGALVFDGYDDRVAISFADTIGVGEDFTILADYQPIYNNNVSVTFLCALFRESADIQTYARLFRYATPLPDTIYVRGVRGYSYLYSTRTADPKVELPDAEYVYSITNSGLEDYKFNFLHLNGFYLFDEEGGQSGAAPTTCAFYKVALYKGVMTQEEMDEEIAKQFPGSKSVRALTSDDVAEYTPSDNLSDYQKYIVIPMDELYSKDDNWSIRITNVARTEAVVHLEEYDRWYPPIYRTVSEGEQERVYIHPVITGRELKDLLETPEWKSDVEAI